MIFLDWFVHDWKILMGDGFRLTHRTQLGHFKKPSAWDDWCTGPISRHVQTAASFWAKVYQYTLHWSWLGNPQLNGAKSSNYSRGMASRMGHELHAFPNIAVGNSEILLEALIGKWWGIRHVWWRRVIARGFSRPSRLEAAPFKNQVPTAQLTAESMESWDGSWHGGSSLRVGTPFKVAINNIWTTLGDFKGREDTKSPLADRAPRTFTTNPSEAVSVWTEATSVLTRTYTKTYSHNYAYIYNYIYIHIYIVTPKKMLVNHYFSEGFLKFPYYILLQDEYIWWWMDLGNARLYDVERFSAIRLVY